MKKLSENPATDWDKWRQGIIGLGEHSGRKSYYPELQRQLAELERFRALLDQSNDAIFLVEADSAILTDVSESACRQLDFTREELLERPAQEVISPAALMRIRALFSDRTSTARGGTLTTTLYRRDGTAVPIEMDLQMVSLDIADYAVVVGRDITERRQAEAALQESETKYRTIFEHCGNPLLFIGEDTTIILANKEFETLSGYSRAELEGRKTWTEFVRREDDLKRMMEYHRLRRIDPLAAPRSYEFRFFDRRGRMKNVVVSVTMIPGTNQSLAAFLDITAHKQMEATLIRRERLAAMGELAGGVAHNFNNLLQMIMGAGEAALAKLNAGDIGKCKEAIDTLIDASRRGTDTVSRIRDFTLLETKESEKNGVFDMGALIEEAVQLTRLLWKDPVSKQKHRLNYFKPLGGTVRGNSSQLYEVVVNIVKNGLEAMPLGGVLSISPEIRNGRISIEIADTGEGIAKENLARIFQPFYTTRGNRRSGLGLSSSYGIVKKHQGELLVRSNPGGGTTFTVVLPLCTPATTCRMEMETAERADPSIRHKFLVIDDEPNILKMMAMWFEDSEFEIHTADTAEKGLQAVRRERFDVILCDFGMDDLNGLEVGREIKTYFQKAALPKIPFLLYTGLDAKLTQVKLDAAGVDRIVKKPISSEKLLRILREVVEPTPSSPQR